VVKTVNLVLDLDEDDWAKNRFHQMIASVRSENDY
jgi:hypothetical protein